jgi:DNA helicase-2/ATP-dependent DNA helicase PcrA
MSALNEAQYEAVVSGEGPVLIIAGAGAGKTRTIIYRVAWLVERGVPPESILLLTFTRRAAQEMLSRAQELLDRRVAGAQGGTFHSVANLMLRRYAWRIGYDSSFSIMDQSDSVDAVDHIKKSLGPPIKDMKSMPRSRTIAGIISRSVNTDLGIQGVLNAYYSQFSDKTSEIKRISKAYQDYKTANNLMDYDDLLINLARILEEDEDIRREVSLSKRHILVDEYQDTNPLQAKITKLLASAHGNVMVVGDDSQSIYSFRGATFENIINFPKEFPGAKVIKLVENYRSILPILNVTNEIISRARTGYEKKLFTRSVEGPAPLFHRPYSEREQSKFVVNCVRELSSYGFPMSDTAVLFRAGHDSFDLEGELARNDIPFVKHGGFKFLESQHTKDVLAHLKVAHNPRDQLSWNRILKLIPGIGPKTSMKISEKLASSDEIAGANELAKPGAKYHRQLSEIIQMIRDLKAHSGPVSEKVATVNKSYFDYLKQAFDNYPKRMRDLEELTDMALQYSSLNRFLNDMALDPIDTDPQGLNGQESLTLSTIHSAKGLEWRTVILLWACEGKIPSPMSEDEDELEEERRLVYVATTRAKHNLVITAPQTRLDRRIGVLNTPVSRFFSEIPDGLFRKYRG